MEEGRALSNEAEMASEDCRLMWNMKVAALNFISSPLSTATCYLVLLHHYTSLSAAVRRKNFTSPESIPENSNPVRSFYSVPPRHNHMVGFPISTPRSIIKFFEDQIQRASIE